jgi:hypothetical protein
VTGAPRSPGSARWDTRARYALNRAVEAHAVNGAARVFIHSPGPQFRRLDRGGRTVNERAFTRAVYYPVYAVPRALGELPVWSLKLEWGPIERHGDRYGRTAAVRLYRYASGYRHASGQASQYTAGQGRSTAGDRVDS